MGGRFARRQLRGLAELERQLARAQALPERDHLLEADLLERVGLVYLTAREHGKAEKALREAVVIDSSSPQAHRNWKRSQRHQVLGGCLAEQGRMKEALAEFRRSLDFALVHGEETSMEDVARYFLANHLVSMGRCAEALEVLANGAHAATFAKHFERVRRRVAGA